MRKKKFIKIIALSFLATCFAQSKNSIAADQESDRNHRGLSLSPDLSGMHQHSSEASCQGESPTLPSLRFGSVISHPRSQPLSQSHLAEKSHSPAPSTKPVTSPITFPSPDIACHRPIPIPHTTSRVMTSHSTQTMDGHYVISGDDYISNLIRDLCAQAFQNGQKYINFSTGPDKTFISFTSNSDPLLTDLNIRLDSIEEKISKINVNPQPPKRGFIRTTCSLIYKHVPPFCFIALFHYGVIQPLFCSPKKI